MLECKEIINNLKDYTEQITDKNTIVVNNNKPVGKDSLTWISSNNRAKIYNKLNCQITIPGVNKK